MGTADSALTVGDVDGDGKAEIVVTSGTNIVVIAGDGSSTRSIPVPLATIFDGSRNTTIFDLNGDGKPELIHQGLRSSFDTASQTGGLSSLTARPVLSCIPSEPCGEAAIAALWSRT